MLKKAHRLSRVHFEQVSKGKRAISAHFSVTTLPADTIRAAAVVSKKVAKKSVDRHLLKRRMLEAVRPLLPAGRAIVLYARAGSPSLPYRALKDELQELFSKL